MFPLHTIPCRVPCGVRALLSISLSVCVPFLTRACVCIAVSLVSLSRDTLVHCICLLHALALSVSLRVFLVHSFTAQTIGSYQNKQLKCKQMVEKYTAALSHSHSYSLALTLSHLRRHEVQACDTELKYITREH